MNFLEKLQALDGETKQKVLIGATAVIMIVVVYVWLGYFNNLLAGIPQNEQVAQGQAAAPPAAAAPVAVVPAPAVSATAQASAPAFASGQPGIWQNMKDGLANIYNAITGSRQFDIQPK